MKRPGIMLIGTEPNKMTRLRRTFTSLVQFGADVRVFVPYDRPAGRPRVLKGIVRYIISLIQVMMLKSEIYHLYNVPDVVGLPLVLKPGILVYDVRSPWFSTIKESVSAGPLWRLAKAIEWFLTRKADVVLCTNTPLAERARAWGARRVIVLPNYSPADFRPSRERASVRAELGLGVSPTVLYLGRVSVLEGSRLLRDIMLAVLKADSRVRFLVVGDGPSKKWLENQVSHHGLSDRVVFAGWVSHDQVPNYINAADLCLLPRLWTSWSTYVTPENILKVSEYLVVGRPVVAPKMGGFVDAEFPVIAVEPDRMAEAVLDYIRNPRPVDTNAVPTWEISHKLLHRLYRHLGALENPDTA